MFLTEKQFKIFLLVGAVILIVGLVLWWCPASVIGGLEEKSSETGLSQDLRDKLQGSLNSWRILQITTFQPLSNILLAVGVIVIVDSIVITAFPMIREACAHALKRSKIYWAKNNTDDRRY